MLHTHPQPYGRRLALLGGAFLLLLAPGGSASAMTSCPSGDPAVVQLCFDDVPSLTAASSHDFGPVSILDGTILSEAQANLALGLDTTGWATTGDQGVLNDLEPILDFSFAIAIVEFRVDVVALPGPLGDPVPVVVQGFRDGALIGTDLLAAGSSMLSGVFDTVRIFAAVAPCSGSDCEVDVEGLFFADTVEYIVPEPKTITLVALGLAALAGRGRRCA